MYKMNTYIWIDFNPIKILRIVMMCFVHFIISIKMRYLKSYGVFYNI